MAWTRLVTGSNAGNISCNIDYNIGSVTRSGNTVTVTYGIRFQTSQWTYNSIAAFCPSGGTKYYAFYSPSGGSHTETNGYYYANSGDWTKTTDQGTPFTQTISVSTNQTSASFRVGFGWNGWNPTEVDSAAITVTFPAGFTYPYWTKYTINSSPSTAYANMPYSFNVDLACNYGSSTSDNLLYWEAAPGNNGYVTLASTTGTALTAGARSFTFNTSQIGAYYVRGVIRYNDGSTKHNVHETTYPLTVSWLDPTITGVSNVLNATNFYRTSTVSSTASATVTSNSAAPYVYTYFSSPNAPGDGSDTGTYKIANYAAAGTNSFNSITKSYSHPGNKPGTFYARLSLRADNASGTWTEYATPGQVSYTMHEFVAPTMTRALAYQKNNIYVGQTKLPVRTIVTAVSKSQYDTLTPTCAVIPLKGGSAISGVSSAHNWANGTYNATLTVPACVSGDTISFRDQMTYKDALNADAYDNVDSTSYTVKAIPTPTSSAMQLGLTLNEIDKTLLVDVTSNIDSDFMCYYTLYIENADGTKQYATYNGSVTGSQYVSKTYNYDKTLTEDYRAILVCYYALVDETNVKGSSATFTTSTVGTYGGSKLAIKHGNSIEYYYLSTDIECPRPRLAIKNGNTIHYLPLKRNNFQSGFLTFKNGSTVYQAIKHYIPSTDTKTNIELEVYTHRELSQWTNDEIRIGDV